ncbi:MAG TPA: NUDIX hydrolase [Anaerolineales bacterium]|nr:NUDIX hydrolase [Anaerolineales bacterium]
MVPRLLKTETIYRGRTFSLRVDELEFHPGRSTRLDIVEHGGAVTMLPLDHENNIWFIRQYRHSVGDVLLELPAGALGEGEDPRAGAERELQEEIGMRPGRLEWLLDFWLAPGYSTELMHVYLATGLTPSKLAHDEDEVIEIEKIPAARAAAMAASGELRDSKSLVSVLVAAKRLGW